ncbi:MAG TPA: hypothetical protein VK066_06985 [Chloroflexota bacterium]|nr:hypothetical protein [Chloroflexota bacterium]
MRPYQQPHPPLWYPTSGPDGEWMVRHGFNTVAGALFLPAWSSLGEERTLHSLRLFAREVMPALRVPPAALPPAPSERAGRVG